MRNAGSLVASMFCQKESLRWNSLVLTPMKCIQCRICLPYASHKRSAGPVWWTWGSHCPRRRNAAQVQKLQKTSYLLKTAGYPYRTCTTPLGNYMILCHPLISHSGAKGAWNCIQQGTDDVYLIGPFLKTY